MTSRSDDLRAQMVALKLSPPFREQDGEVCDALGRDVALPNFDSWRSEDDRPLARLIAAALNAAAGVEAPPAASEPAPPAEPAP